jgi:hypothetical protein
MAVVAGAVACGSDDEGVVVVEVWSQDPGQPVTAPAPAPGDQTVVALTDPPGGLLFFRTAGGTPTGEVAVPAAQHPPSLLGGLSVAVDLAGTARGIDGAGQTAWTLDPLGTVLPPVVAADRMFVATTSGRVVAIAPDGTLRTLLDRPAALPTAIAASGQGTVAVALGGGEIAWLDGTGSVLDELDGPSVDALGFVGSRLLVARGGSVDAFDAPGSTARSLADGAGTVFEIVDFGGGRAGLRFASARVGLVSGDEVTVVPVPAPPAFLSSDLAVLENGEVRVVGESALVTTELTVAGASGGYTTQGLTVLGSGTGVVAIRVTR